MWVFGVGVFDTLTQLVGHLASDFVEADNEGFAVGLIGESDFVLEDQLESVNPEVNATALMKTTNA